MAHEPRPGSNQLRRPGAAPDEQQRGKDIVSGQTQAGLTPQIEIRCKACHKLAMKVSADATGTIMTRCKKNTCGKWITVTLPLRKGNVGSGGPAPAPATPPVSENVTAH